MDSLIIKKVIHAGTKAVNFVPGTKVVFHFKTTKCDSSKTVIDDSKEMGKPMELVLGKQFKLDVWEVIVQKMALNEVALFIVDKTLVSPYPFVSKTLREAGKPVGERRNHHCCGVTLQNEGIGYDDLNNLIKNPQNLEFTIELLQVILPHEYEKESWQMTEDEKLKNVPILREKGNVQFREKNYEAAANTYAQALGILEQLMLAEKPHDTEWLNLNEMKIPLLLNYAQCKLLNKEYYSVIEHCTTVLKTDPNNVKALYRRGKAHIGAWNENEAITDLTKAAELDKSLESAINKELQSFFLAVKNRNKIQSQKLVNFFKS
ncbi:aryl-hydrocarbon-interacting protein-like 1 [Phymastichus coffea]|uniref:aryl-hydrocarbon-interacting protein-like 1 n=1 Tax=Phymastichus coffea TaxID=108790 RepID=UPI00273BB821|nr:aryl-hydrocarbon-interacting protein-like 1 [Phymastichus coffea]